MTKKDLVESRKPATFSRSCFYLGVPLHEISEEQHFFGLFFEILIFNSIYVAVTGIICLNVTMLGLNGFQLNTCTKHLFYHFHIIT